MNLDADWSIGVRSGAVHPLQIQYHTAESKTRARRFVASTSLFVVVD